MFSPLFIGTTFSNLLKEQKKSATVTVNLNFNPVDTSIFVTNSGRGNQLLGFYNPETGIYERSDELEKVGVLNKFRLQALKYAQKAVQDKLSYLKSIQTEKLDAYQNMYKPISQIQKELAVYLDTGFAFYKQLDTQLKTIAPVPEPTPNELLVYRDDDLLTSSKQVVTTHALPFSNPKRQHTSDFTFVEKFLNVFFDSDNEAVFSWYMGAVFLNLPINDDHISRYLVISSRNGGVGKSTLLDILGKALLGESFVTASDFDSYFAGDNRFGTSSLPHERLCVYSEADFQGAKVVDGDHDFTGLNTPQIKALATQGLLNAEAKYEATKISRFQNLHIILTNFPPNIPDGRTDLARRFLSCLLRPTSMASQKAQKLGNKSTAELIAIVKAHGQEFIDYFASSYLANPDKFKDELYRRQDVTDDELQITNQEKLVHQQKQAADKDLDGLVLLASLCKRSGITYQKLISNIKSAKVTATADIRWDESNIYLNSSKTFFRKYSGLSAIRDELLALYPPYKKFGKNMVCLPIKRS